MTAPRREDWRRVREVFEAALAQPAVYRQPFVAEACRGEPGIYDQVIGLLASHDSAATFLETPAARLLDDGPWADLAGQRIGPYHLEARIGGGGMGEVFRADDIVLGQPVALKFLPEAAKTNVNFLTRFYDEVRIARQISHPNVCRVYDMGELDGHPYLSMEYIDGEDLASLLRRIGRLPGDKAAEFARKICAGVAAAHAQGVLHRDIKPGNIMIDGRGEPRVTDFGLAALASAVEGSEIRNGTPAYMAP